MKTRTNQGALMGHGEKAYSAQVARWPKTWPMVQLPSCLSAPRRSEAARRLASSRTSSMEVKWRKRRSGILVVSMEVFSSRVPELMRKIYSGLSPRPRGHGRASKVFQESLAEHPRQVPGQQSAEHAPKLRRRSRQQ